MMIEMLFTGLLLTHMWCTTGPVHSSKRNPLIATTLCDDGSQPHLLEMRVIDGTADPPADVFKRNFDNAKIKSLIVIKKDGVEIVNVPVPDTLTKDDLQRLLEGFRNR